MQNPTDPSPRPLSFTGAYTDITWTRDGQIISDQDNRLFLINTQTAMKTPIATEEGHPAGDPSACPDGRYVVFVLGFHANSTDQNIWRVDSSGGNLTQLTKGKNDTYPICSPDSQSVYFVSQQEENKLAMVPIGGGEAKVLTDVPISGTANTFDISPDGKLVAFPTLEHSGEHKERLALLETGSGHVAMRDLDRLRFGMIHFDQSGKGVIYPARDGGADSTPGCSRSTVQRDVSSPLSRRNISGTFTGPRTENIWHRFAGTTTLTLCSSAIW